jgi:hypothetical protein
MMERKIVKKKLKRRKEKCKTLLMNLVNMFQKFQELKRFERIEEVIKLIMMMKLFTGLANYTKMKFWKSYNIKAVFEYLSNKVVYINL